MPAINYQCYSNCRVMHSRCRLCQLLHEFVLLIWLFTKMLMILFCNLVCVYIHKTCEEKFGGCKKLFSWLGQKVSNGSDPCGYDVDESGADLCPWPRDDTASRQDISTPFNIVIEFKATEHLYSIWHLICIRNFEDIRFKWNSRFVPSWPPIPVWGNLGSFPMWAVCFQRIKLASKPAVDWGHASRNSSHQASISPTPSPARHHKALGTAEDIPLKPVNPDDVILLPRVGDKAVDGL